MKKLGLILVVVLFIVILSIYGSPDNKNVNNISNETKLNKEENNNNNESNEKVNEEIVNEIEDEIANEIENTISSETFEESPKTAEEKAIDIVKKDWGNSNNVNFSVQGMDGNGNYIIVVSDSNTVALAFYTVNVSNETFTKREMN